MTDASRIWMPDTFFRNEKFGSFHTILQPNLYIRIFPDGNILYSIRYICMESQYKAAWFLFPLILSSYKRRLDQRKSSKIFKLQFKNNIQLTKRQKTMSEIQKKIKSFCLMIFGWIRVSLTAACSMHLALFPLDEQVCHLYIASCKY